MERVNIEWTHKRQQGVQAGLNTKRVVDTTDKSTQSMIIKMYRTPAVLCCLWQVFAVLNYECPYRQFISLRFTEQTELETIWIVSQSL